MQVVKPDTVDAWLKNAVVDVLKKLDSERVDYIANRVVH